MEFRKIVSAQRASQLIQQVDHIPTAIPLLPSRFVSEYCHCLQELLLNSLLAFKTREQTLENRLQNEL